MSQKKPMPQSSRPRLYKRPSFYGEYQASVDQHAIKEPVSKLSKAQPQQAPPPPQQVTTEENELVRCGMKLINAIWAPKTAKPQQTTAPSAPHQRGTSPYCAYRPLRTKTRPYRTLTEGQSCQCPGTETHPAFLPSEWISTPAEADWDYGLPNGGWGQRERVVRFVEPVVSRVVEVEKWVEEAYGVFRPMGAKAVGDVCEKRDAVEEWLEEADRAMERAMRAWEAREGEVGEEEEGADDEDEDDDDEMEWWDADEMQLGVEDKK